MRYGRKQASLAIGMQSINDLSSFSSHSFRILERNLSISLSVTSHRFAIIAGLENTENTEITQVRTKHSAELFQSFVSAARDRGQD